MRKIILLSLLIVSFLPECRAVWSPVSLYVYGFSFSFNDSTVYITDIMQLDSAWTDNRTKFLYARSSYSYQLKEYLLTKGVENPTCIISFSDKRKKAEKMYVKLKGKYAKKGETFTVKYIPSTDFSFSAVSAADDPSAVKGGTKEEIKAAKKAAKEEKKAQKQAAKEESKKSGRPGPGGQNGRPAGPPPDGKGGGPR